MLLIVVIAKGIRDCHLKLKHFCTFRCSKKEICRLNPPGGIQPSISNLEICHTKWVRGFAPWSWSIFLNTNVQRSKCVSFNHFYPAKHIRSRIRGSGCLPNEAEAFLPFRCSKEGICSLLPIWGYPTKSYSFGNISEPIQPHTYSLRRYFYVIRELKEIWFSTSTTE